jgi:peptidoglycan/xylan/chitin deacetylase (PgdA/CDA1 family)
MIIRIIYGVVFIGSGIFVKAFCKLPVKEKVLALTFDDGPNPTITPQVLEILNRYNIQAIFFCIGKNIAGNETLVQQSIAEGHLIGNHTYSHSSFFPLLSVSKMKADIQKCEDLISGISHQKELSLFRPPFGVTNPNVRKAVIGTGYQIIGWNIRSLDTVKSSADQVIRRVTKKIKPGSIILFHDSMVHCPEILEAVIKYALEKGYKFVRADKYL